MPKNNKKYYGKKKKSAGQEALKKVNAIIKMSELKHFTTAQNLTININWNGQIVSGLNNPPAGTGDTNRIGDQIACTYWIFNMFLFRSQDIDNFVRVIGFWDKKNTIADASSILDSLGTINAPNQVSNVDRRSEYIKLFDKTINLNNAGGLQGPQKHLRVRVSLKKRLSQFVSASTNLASGVLKFFIVSDVDAAAANKPEYIFISRVRYRDN